MRFGIESRTRELGVAILCSLMVMLALGFGIGYAIGREEWPNPTAVCGSYSTLILYTHNTYSCAPA